MDLVNREHFSEIQIFIIQNRLKDDFMTYEELSASILEKFAFKMHDTTTQRVLKRSALNLRWTPRDSKGGSYPYLCDEDMAELESFTKDMANSDDGNVYILDFLEKARELREKRLAKAIQFLMLCHCPKIAESIVYYENTEPSRSWINEVVEKLSIRLQKPIYIDVDRRDACSRDRLVNFYLKFKTIISETPKCLLFGADETMMSTTYRGKILLPDDDEPHSILKNEFKVPHITALCVHNVIGVHPPPFIILPGIQHLPAELNEFAESGRAWFSSSTSGWMTRDLFFLFAIHFINWLSQYRTTLSASLRDLRALLIMDGHTSRECPLALLLLRNAKVDVLIIPGHTSHVTQMFDVVLASALKSTYTKILNQMLKKSDTAKEITTYTGKVRYLAVFSFITAWDSVCTLSNCERAAAKCGYYPFNENAITTSVFVEIFSEEREALYQEKMNQRTRLDINSKIITDPDNLREIAEMISKSPHLAHLIPGAIPMRYTEIINMSVKRQMPNKTFFLGRLPPFVTGESKIVYFPEPND